MQSLASVKETAKHSPWYLVLFFIKVSIHHYLKYLTWTAFICFLVFCGSFLLFFSIKFNSVKILILFVFSYYPQHLEKYLAQEVFVEWMRFLDILPDVFLYIYIHMATQKEIKILQKWHHTLHLQLGNFSSFIANAQTSFSTNNCWSLLHFKIVIDNSFMPITGLVEISEGSSLNSLK